MLDCFFLFVPLPLHCSLSLVAVHPKLSAFCWAASCRLTCFPVEIVCGFFRCCCLLSIRFNWIRDIWPVKSMFRISHNLFWLPSCGDSRVNFFLFHFHILHFKSIETLCCYDNMKKMLYLFIVFPKRSWRSTVVPHFRFNKNVFIYWRDRFGALTYCMKQQEREREKKQRAVHGNVQWTFSITSSASCNWFFISLFSFILFIYNSSCLSAGYLIQMRACLVILLTARHESFLHFLPLFIVINVFILHFVYSCGQHSTLKQCILWAILLVVVLFHHLEY